MFYPRKYKLRRYRKTRTYRKKRRYGKRYNKLTASKMHPEFKAIDISQNTDTAILDSGLILAPCPSITKGDEVYNRQGEQVTLRSFQYRVCPSGDDEAIGGSPIRLLVLVDKQANGVTPAALTGIVADTSNPINSPLSLGITQRYDILRDKVYNLDADDPSRFIKGYIRMNRVVKYTSGTAPPMTNNLLFILLSNRTVAEKPPVTTIYARTRFTDM